MSKNPEVDIMKWPRIQLVITVIYYIYTYIYISQPLRM